MITERMDDEDIETLAVCSECDGNGEVPCEDDEAVDGEMDECPMCNGEGYLPNAD